jgi:hypothetical protein
MVTMSNGYRGDAEKSEGLEEHVCDRISMYLKMAEI